jgi:hypothetical protein
VRDDASLRRLAEMGVDVYVPRTSRRASDAAVASVTMPAALSRVRESDIAEGPAGLQASAVATVLLLAEADSRSAVALLKDVTRTLAFAQIRSAAASSLDESLIAAAGALVMFGEGQARAVGALIPAQRQRDIGWVVSAEPARLARDAQAKRALWSELKRMARGLRAASQGPLAARGAGDDHRVH